MAAFRNIEGNVPYADDAQSNSLLKDLAVGLSGRYCPDGISGNEENECESDTFDGPVIIIQPIDEKQLRMGNGEHLQEIQNQAEFGDLNREIKKEIKKEIEKEIKVELKNEIKTEEMADTQKEIKTESMTEVKTEKEEGMSIKKEIKKEIKVDVKVENEAGTSDANVETVKEIKEANIERAMVEATHCSTERSDTEDLEMESEDSQMELMDTSETAQANQSEAVASTSGAQSDRSVTKKRVEGENYHWKYVRDVDIMMRKKVAGKEKSQTTSPKKRHRCPKCPMRFSRKDLLKFHLSKHEVTPDMIACHICGQRMTRQDFARHRFTHLLPNSRGSSGRSARNFQEAVRRHLRRFFRGRPFGPPASPVKRLTDTYL